MPDRQATILPPVVVGHGGRRPTPKDEQELGPAEGWETYQEQPHAQEAANAEHLKNHPGTIANAITINEAMPTESDEIRQNDGGSKLTTRQARFLPILLASRTYTQACQAGRVSRDTLYEWLKDPAFKAELGRQRDELVA